MKNYDYQKKMLSTEQVFQMIKEAIRRGKGLSLIRIGDGETRAIAHNDLITMNEVPDWIRYSGVLLPDQAIKKELIASIRRADIVGLPLENYYYFKPLMLEIINKYQISLEQSCPNRINYYLFNQGYLRKIIAGHKVIIIGRKAALSSPYFSQFATIVATYNLPNTFFVNQLFQQIKEEPAFEIALVAAGIPAVILCPMLADLKKVAIDLGHVIDGIVEPEKDLFKLMGEWLENNKPGG